MELNTLKFYLGKKVRLVFLNGDAKTLLTGEIKSINIDQNTVEFFDKFASTYVLDIRRIIFCSLFEMNVMPPIYDSDDQCTV